MLTTIIKKAQKDSEIRSAKVAKMIAIGGTEWEKYEMHRVYFDRDVLAGIYGLEVTRYGTGSISSARLDGESISNSKAHKILASFPSKFWYDIPKGTYGHRGDDSMVDSLIEKIGKKLS